MHASSNDSFRIKGSNEALDQKRHLKVLFIIQNYHLPSSRVRVLNLLPELGKHGIEAVAIPFPKPIFEQIKLFNQCRKMDIVVLQKRLLSLSNISIIAKLSTKLVFDFDDAIYTKQHEGKVTTSKGRFKKFIKTIRYSDGIIAGNRVLAEMASSNSNITVIPSAVETRGVAQKNYAGKSNNIIIGWVGTAVNLAYLQLLQPQLERLSKEHNLELRIICSESIEMLGVKTTFIPWSLETQEAEIAQFDIGVMPLPDSEHASGKCGYKALQYMAAAVPAVISDVGINNEIISDHQDGMLANTINDFYSALKYLMDHPEERIRVGLAGRRRVEMQYSIGVVAKQLADALHQQAPASE